MEQNPKAAAVVDVQYGFPYREGRHYRLPVNKLCHARNWNDGTHSLTALARAAYDAPTATASACLSL